MKTFLPLIMMSLSFNVFAITGADLIKAKEAAIVEASVELDLDTITAFKVEPADHDHKSEEIEVVFKAGEELHTFGCHYHGTDMACHEEHDGHDDKGTASDFDHVVEGHSAAIEKLEKTLRRRGSDLNALESIKVWVVEDDDHGHGHGADVWTKVTYELNNRDLTVFVQCHEHHDHKEEGMFCHYRSKGKDEPNL